MQEEEIKERTRKIKEEKGKEPQEEENKRWIFEKDMNKK